MNGTSSGDAALAAMWEPHGWQAKVPKTEHFCIVFMPQFLATDVIGEVPWLKLFAAPPDQRPRVGDERARSDLHLLGQMMKREAAERPAAWEEMTRLHLSQVLILLQRCWSPCPSSEERWSRRHMDLARIMPALELFRGQRAEVSVVEAAAACSLSRSHFDAVFRRVIGMSFGRFRARARVELATHLLITTDLTLSDVAAAAGFVDASHLHRAFVKWYGCAPGKYRQSGDPQREKANAR